MNIFLYLTVSLKSYDVFLAWNVQSESRTIFFLREKNDIANETAVGQFRAKLFPAFYSWFSSDQPMPLILVL